VRGEKRKGEKDHIWTHAKSKHLANAKKKKMEKRSPKAWLQLGMSHARKKNIIDHAPMTDGVCG
jgi:hypothetical protein